MAQSDCFSKRKLPPYIARERNRIADEKKAVPVIPVIRDVVRIEPTLRVIQIEVRRLKITVQKFRMYACSPPHTVATVYCI